MARPRYDLVLPLRRRRAARRRPPPTALRSLSKLLLRHRPCRRAEGLVSPELSLSTEPVHSLSSTNDELLAAEADNRRPEPAPEAEPEPAQEEAKAKKKAARQPSEARDPPGTYRDGRGTLRSEANDGVLIDRTEAQWKDSSFRVREMD